MINLPYLSDKDVPALNLYCKLNPVPEWFEPEESLTLAQALKLYKYYLELTSDF